MKTIYLQDENYNWIRFGYESLSDIEKELSQRDITIGNGATIGYEATIGNGATIGDEATSGSITPVEVRIAIADLYRKMDEHGINEP